MKLRLKIAVLVCALVVLIGGYFWLDRKFREGMAYNYEFKRMHMAPGTLKSIHGAATDSPASSSTDAHTVCFTIDSFSDIPRDLQTEYAEAERSRAAKNGPRCIHVPDQQSSIEGKPGEAIQIYFLLYGHGEITVERVAVRGRELDPI